MDRKLSVTRPLKSHLFVLCILVLIGLQHGYGATVSLTPSRASSFYTGVISLQIDGLTNGETVRVEKFIDVNTNNAVNAIDMMVDSFLLTDNQSIAVGGVTNRHRPYDRNPANGVITADLPFHHVDIDHVVARYIFRVSSLTGRFVSSNGLFRVTNSADAQSVRGLIRNSGTNVPYGIVGALREGPDGPGYVAAALAASNGFFTLNLPMGAYRLIGVKRGFVGNFETAPAINLTAGANLSNNVSITLATRSISGRLVDAGNTNSGIPGLQMFVSSNPYFTLAFSDTNGNFSVPVQPGIWRVEPEERVLAVRGYLGLDDEPIADTSTSSVSNMVIALDKATALIYGTLKSPSNAPIAGIEVFAYAGGNMFDTRGVTDAGGEFFLGVTANNWSVNARSEELSALGYLSGSSVGTNLLAGQAARIDLTSVPVAAFLQGRVIDESGAAVTNADLRASNYSGSYSYAVTGPDGSFSVGVGEGTWYLQLDSNEDEPAMFASPETSFVVTSGSNVVNITYRVLRTTNTVNGFVTDNAQMPIGDMRLYAWADIDGVRYQTSGANSQPDGSYSLQVSAGTWQVGVECFRAEGRGYNCPREKSVAIPATGNVDFTLLPWAGTTTIDSLVLLQSGRIRFRVTGTPGYNYTIDTSTDLKDWVPLFSTNAPAMPFYFVDTSAFQWARYFRVSRWTP
jgi:hypothetical protein